MRTLFGSSEPSVSTGFSNVHVLHAHDGVVVLPDREILIQGFYSRVGTDLVITTPDGVKYIVKGFYLSDHPPLLTDGAGTDIPGDLAGQFAGPVTTDQYAGTPTNLGPAVGQARSLTGTVTATRANGVTVTLKVGDPVYMGDVIETGPGAKLGLVFIDGMTLALGENGDLVLDEMVYNPATKGGKAAISLVSGAAEFVSGTIAHSGQDNMTFKTPVGTIGIRGTKVFVSFDPVTGDVSIINRPTGTDPQGNVTAGEIFLSLPDGTPIGSMTSGNGGWQWNPQQGQAPQVVQLTEAQVQTIANTVENTVNGLQTPDVQAAQQGQGTTNITSQPAGATGATGTDQGAAGGQGGTTDGAAGQQSGTGNQTGTSDAAPTTTTPTTTSTPASGTQTTTTTNALSTTPTTGSSTITAPPPSTTPVTPIITPPQPPATFELSGGGSVTDIVAGKVTFTITRGGNLAVAVSVNYSTQDGSAQAGSDYTAASGTLDFAVGETTKTVEVSIAANSRIEPQEAFSLVLSGGSTNTVIVSGSAGVTIAADPPLPTLTIGNVTVTDTQQNTASITVTRSGDVTAASSVKYQTVAGSAQAGSDFTATSGTIQFAAGQTTATISVPILANSTPLTLANREGAETFTVVLSDPTDATITQDTGTVTISADPVVGLATFSVSSAQVSEGDTATITVTRGGDLVGQVTVDYATASGTATSGADFTARSGTLTFAANETTKTITIPIVKDTVQEGAESFTVGLQNPVGGTITQGTGTVSIAADAVVPTISISSTSVSGTGGTATLTISLSAATTVPVTVNYSTVNGSAEAGSDYSASSGSVTIAAGQTSASISIGVAANTTGEGAESFSVVLSGAVNGTIGTGTGSVDISAVPVVTLGTVQFSINSTIAASDTSANTVNFTVTRSGETTVAATVHYTTVSGTATSGTDFTATSGTLAFAAGQTTATIAIPILSDSTGESAETFTVVLSSPTATGTTATISSGTGTVTIAADPITNVPPTFSTNGTIAPVLDGNLNPTGTVIAAVLGVYFSDANAGDTFAGVVVVGNSANASTEGAWQYSSDNGSHWYDIGAVADDSTALIVSADALIRFVPVSGFTGTPTSLTLRGMDSTYSGSFSVTSTSETRVTLGATTTGGSSPISGSTNTLSVTAASSVHWTKGATGTWTDNTGWNNLAVPTASDRVSLNGVAITLSNSTTNTISSLTLDGTSSLTVSGGSTTLALTNGGVTGVSTSLTLSGSTLSLGGVFVANGTLNLDGGATISNSGIGGLAIGGPFYANSGTISARTYVAPNGSIYAYDTHNTVTFTGQLDIGPDGYVELKDGDNGDADTEITTGVINNRGIVQLTVAAGGYTDGVILHFTTFNNVANGELTTNVGASSGGTRTLNGAALNNFADGTISINYNATYSGGTLTNAGEIFVDTNQTLTIASGATLKATGGYYDGAGTIAIAPGGVFQVNANITADSQLVVGSYGGTSAIVRGTGTLTINNSANINSGEVSTPVIIDSGTLYAYDTIAVPVISGHVTITSDGTIEIKDSNNGDDDTRLDISGGVDNSGTVILTIAAGGFSDNVILDLTGGTFNNLSGGFLLTSVGASSTGTRTIIGSINNNTGGTIQIDYSASYQGGTLTNGGAIEVASGYTFRIDSGTLTNATGGGTSGSGTLLIAGGSIYRFDASGTVASGLQLGEYAGTAATMSRTGSAVATISGDFYVKAGTVTVPLIVSSTGSIYAYDSVSSTVLGTVTVQSGGKIEIKDLNNSDADTALFINGTVNNSGTVTLTIAAGGFSDNVTLDLTGGTFNNLSGGILTTQNGASSTGTRTIIGTINNNSSGTIQIDYSATYQGGTLTNAGTIAVASSQVLTVSSGTVVMSSGGATSGAGEIILGAGSTLRFDANATIGSGLELGTYGSAAATMSRTSSSVATISGAFYVNAGTATVPLIVSSTGAIYAYNTVSSAVLGAVTVQSGGLIEIKDGNNSDADTKLAINGTVNNAGTIRLTTSAGGFTDNVTLDLTGGTLNNNSGSTLVTDNGASSGGTRTIIGDINNAGTGLIDINYSATYQGGTLTNIGNIDVASGQTLTVSSGNIASGTGASYTGSGAMTLGGGVSMDFSAAATIALTLNLGTYQSSAATISSTGGTPTISGTLAVNSGTVSAPLIVASGGSILAYDTSNIVTLSGTITVNSGGVIELRDGNNSDADTELNVTGTVNNSGTVRLTTVAGGFTDGVILDLTGGTFNNLSGGTLVTDNGASSGGSRSIVGTVNNNTGGTVDINYSASYSGTLSNAGNIDVASGTAFTIQSGSTLVQQSGGTYTGAGTLVVASGATWRFDASGSIASTLSAELGTYNGTSATLSRTSSAVPTVAGTLYLYSGTVSAPVTVASGGLLTAYNSQSLVTISAALTIASGGTLEILDGNNSDADTVLYVTSTISNAGTLRLTTAAGGFSDGVGLDLSSGGVLNNTGTLITTTGASSSGTRTITGQINNTGTVTVDYSTTFTIGSTDLNNNSGGTFTIASGQTATLTSGGTGRFVNAGTLTVTGALNLNGHDLLDAGGTINGLGNITFGSGIIIVGYAYTGAGVTLSSGNTKVFGTGASIIGSGTYIIDDGATVRIDDAVSTGSSLSIQLGTYGGAGGAITKTGTPTLTIGGGMDLRSGTIAPTIANSSGSTISALRSDNVVTFSGAVTNAGTIHLEGVGGSSDTEVNFTGGITNTGTIELTSSTSSAAATLDATSSVITNQSAGTINSNAGSGGSRSINGQLLNSGTVNLNAATTFTIGSTDSTNTSSASFNALTGASIITGSGTSKFTNSGVLQVASGASLKISGTTTLTQASGGTYTGTGTLIIANGSGFNLTANVSLASILQVGEYGGSGTTITNTASETLTLNGGGDLRAGTISANVVNASGSTVTALRSDNVVTFSGTVSNAGTLRIEAVGGTSDAEVNFTGALTNTGLIQLTSSTSAAAATLDLTGGSLTNASGGVLSFLVGSGGSRYFKGTVSNSGTININQPTTYQSGILTNLSTIAIPSSNTLTIASGAEIIYGELTSNTNGASTGAGAISNQGTLTLHQGSIVPAITNTSGATITVDAGGYSSRTFALSGTYTANSGSTLRVMDEGSLTIASGFTNNGAILLTNSSSGLNATLTITSGTLTNSSSGTISFLAGSGGGSRTLSGALTNQASGTVTVDGATASISGTINNAGTFTVKNGATLSAANITNVGTFQLTSTGSSGSAAVSLSGTLTNTGTLSILAGLGGSRSITGEIDNSGTVSVATDASFALGTSNFSNSDTFTIASGATATFTGSGSAKILNSSGGTITVTGTLVTNGLDIQNNIGSTFTLNGDVYMGDGAGGSATGGGTFTLLGSFGGSGTLHLEGGVLVGTPIGWTVAPGNSPGMLTIDGSWLFNNAARLDLELAGTSAGQFDVLKVDDHFGLDGTANIIGYHGYVAHAGDSFKVVEFGSHSGMFSEMNGLDATPGIGFDPIFGDHDLTLVARAITNDGTDAQDILTANDSGAVLVGRGGDDILTGGAGDDLLLGGSGNDVLIGGGGSNRLIGGDGIDTADYSHSTAPVNVDLTNGTAITAGGTDTLISIESIIGTSHNDVIVGNQIANILQGGAGQDVLTGGGGNDTFVLNSPTEGGDTITDFTSGEDTLQLDVTAFKLDTGTAKLGENFSIVGQHFDGANAGGNAAFLAGHPTLVYSTADHTLYYDANGTSEGYTTVAVLQPGATLTASDIKITDHLAA